MEIGRPRRKSDSVTLLATRNNDFMNKKMLSTYDKQQLLKRRFIILSSILLVFGSVTYFILANYTSVIEQLMFSSIAKIYGYELSYSNTYSVSESVNREQGNYIKLTDKDNNIHILFRYNEYNNIGIIAKLSDNIFKKEIYVNKSDKNNIQNGDTIIGNIDKEFNWGSTTSVREDGKVGGGYNIVDIGSILNQDNISYESNLLTQQTDNKKEVCGLDLNNIIKYSNSINAKLDILKALVETESSIDDAVIIYNGNNTIYDTSDIIDQTSSNEKLNNDELNSASADRKETSTELNNILKLFAKDKEKIKQKIENNEYTTYTEFIVSADRIEDTSNKNKEVLLDGILIDNLNAGGNEIKNDGIIIGVCVNLEESVKKLNKTLDILAIIQFLERTILL